jgi:Ubiquitin-activating enzyme E1 FCCH domain
MQQQIWNTIDPQLDLSAQTPDGQMLGIIATYYSSNWELLQVCFNQYNREDAEGAALDNIGDLTGTPREGPSYTQVYCELTLAPGDAPYAAGSLTANIEGQPSFTFTNVSAITAAQIAPNVAVANVTNNAGLIEVETESATTLVDGDPVTITGVLGTVEANGNWAAITVIDSTHFTLNGSTFTNAYVTGGIVSYGNPGTATALFQATTIGQTAAVNDGTLNEITVPVTGWTAVNNAGPGSESQAGENEESDYAYAPRQAQELAASGSSNPSATAQALIEFAADLQPPVSINVQVLENPSWQFAVINGVGIPPASYAVIVYDPTDTLTAAQIGQVIYDNKPAGLTPIGNIAVTIVDPVLGNQTVWYSTPATLPLFVTATIVTRIGVNWTALQQAIRSALVEAAVAPTPANGEPLPGQLVPGEDVYASQISAVILGVPGVLDAYGSGGPGTLINIGFSSSPGGTGPLTVGSEQLATIAASTVGTNVVLTQAG